MTVCAAAVLMAAGAPASTPPPEAPDTPGAAELGRARFLMGTVLTIRIPDPPRGADEAIERAFDRVGELETAMTTWRADGELYRLNVRLARGEAAERPVPVGVDLGRALAVSLDWAARTGGLFDPALAPLLDAVAAARPGLRPAETGDVDRRATALRAASVHLERRPDGGLAVRAPRGLRFDLGGIGKGIALDEAARILRRHGVQRAVLDFGGQVLVLDAQAAGPPLPVAIADPRDRSRPAVVVAVAAGSVATSGNAERGEAAAGALRGHIVDPRTGTPVASRASFTVLAPSATAADALATALAAGGPAAGPLVERAGGAWLVLEPADDGELRCLASAALVPSITALVPDASNGARTTRDAFCSPGPAPGQGVDER